MVSLFQTYVVDIEEEANQATESQIFCIVPDLGVCEEEYHRDQGTDDHGILPAESCRAHPARKNRSRDRANVGDGIVAPVDGLRRFSKLCTAGGKVGWQETVCIS